MSTPESVQPSSTRVPPVAEVGWTVGLGLLVGIGVTVGVKVRVGGITVGTRVNVAEGTGVWVGGRGVADGRIVGTALGVNV